MKKGKLVMQYLSSIIFVSTFLIFSTFFVFMPKQKEMAGALSFLGSLNSLSLNEVSGNLNLEYAHPISDEEGQAVESYDFTVTNTSVGQKYQISFSTGTKDDSLDHEAIHYVVKVNDQEYSEVLTLEEDGIIIEDFIEQGETTNISFKYWIGLNNDIDLYNKTIEPTIFVDSVK